MSQPVDDDDDDDDDDADGELDSLLAWPSSLLAPRPRAFSHSSFSNSHPLRFTLRSSKSQISAQITGK